MHAGQLLGRFGGVQGTVLRVMSSKERESGVPMAKAREPGGRGQ